VDDHAISAAKGRLQIGVKVINRRLAMLASDEVADHSGLKRTGAKECQHRDHIFERVRTQVLEQLLHASRFQLEYGCGVALRQQSVNLRIVQRQGHDVKFGHLGIETTDVTNSPVQNGQVAQAQ